MKRSEIWTAAGGPDYAGKPRPVCIVQDDRFEATDSVTVCPFTTDSIDVPLFRPPIQPDAANGLNESSYLMADKITTMPRSKIGKRIGALGDADRACLDRAMLTFLGLAG